MVTEIILLSVGYCTIIGGLLFGYIKDDKDYNIKYKYDFNSSLIYIYEL